MSYVKNHFTKKEQEEIEVLKSNPVVLRLVEELESFYDDPAKSLYKEIVETTKILGEDLKIVRKGTGSTKILGADKDDKLFDRVMNLLTKSSAIFDGISRGKKMIDPEGAKKEEMSKSDDLAF